MVSLGLDCRVRSVSFGAPHIMTTEEAFEDATVDAGWELDQQITVLMKYIDEQDDDASLSDWLFDACPDGEFQSDPEKHIDLLLGYIDNQGSDDEFFQFLEQEAGVGDDYR